MAAAVVRKCRGTTALTQVVNTWAEYATERIANQCLCQWVEITMIWHASLPTAWLLANSKLAGLRLGPQELVVMSAVCFHCPGNRPYVLSERLELAMNCQSGVFFCKTVGCDTAVTWGLPRWFALRPSYGSSATLSRWNCGVRRGNGLVRAG